MGNRNKNIVTNKYNILLILTTKITYNYFNNNAYIIYKDTLTFYYFIIHSCNAYGN